MKRARRRTPSFLLRKASRPRYSLAELLLQIPEGEPIPIDREWDDMPPVGREIEPAPATLRSIRAMRRFLRAQQRRKQQRKRLGRGIPIRALTDTGRE